MLKPAMFGGVFGHLRDFRKPQHELRLAVCMEYLLEGFWAECVSKLKRSLRKSPEWGSSISQVNGGSNLVPTSMYKWRYQQSNNGTC